MSARGPDLADLIRALRNQSGNYDEDTIVEFRTPDGDVWWWDMVDWDGETFVVELAEPYNPESDDDSEEEDTEGEGDE